jgi:hypothetical protein
MKSSITLSVKRCAILSLLFAVCAQGVAAQTRPESQDDEVVRVNAELVQTDVTVVDKRGRFVEDLKPEQFELKVDGRAVPLSFFERVRAGSADEELKLAAARGVKTTNAHTREPIRQTTEGHGRVIFFFVDDLHLSSDSLARARKSLLKFIEEQMASGDLVGIASTSGRAFLNNNSFNDAFRQAVEETSNYYLIAWRPDTDSQRAGDSRIDVSVKGRPDLRVQLRRRYFSARASSDVKDKTRNAPAVKNTSSTATPSSTSTATPPSSTSLPSSTPQASVESPEKAMRAALASLYPLKGLPFALWVGYLDAQGKGTVLAASMEIDAEALDFGDITADSRVALADVWGVAIDDRGSFASFKQVLTISHGMIHRSRRRFVQWSQQLQLPPGLYQVRVAARDRRTGRTGTASQWVEIPEPTSPALSSIFLAEARTDTSPAPVNVSRRFMRGSRLRFQTFVYNAKGSTPSDVTLRVELLRDGASVLTLPEANPSRSNSTDPARLPFSGELSLAELPPGHYVIQISAAAQSRPAATQQANFILE